jgi:hypothetical protein
MVHRSGEDRPLTLLERRIVAALASAMREGMEPKSIYLTPRDYRELRITSAGGLPVRSRRNIRKRRA